MLFKELPLIFGDLLVFFGRVELRPKNRAIRAFFVIASQIIPLGDKESRVSEVFDKDVSV
jgi:hypothetical protein